MVNPGKIKALEDKFRSLGINHSDIVEKFITSGNKGGQKANKSSNAVFLHHIPTGLKVKCTETRERELNRFLARRILAYKIEEKLTGTSDRIREFDKIRKKKSRKRKRVMKAEREQGRNA